MQCAISDEKNLSVSEGEVEQFIQQTFYSKLGVNL